jgi:hypothetical protein
MRRVLIIVGGLLALISLGALAGCSSSGTMDAGKINAAIAQKASENGASVTASCPSGEPAKANYQFVCNATVNGTDGHILVTVLNGNGDLTWQVSQ